MSVESFMIKKLRCCLSIIIIITIKNLSHNHNHNNFYMYDHNLRATRKEVQLTTRADVGSHFSIEILFKYWIHKITKQTTGADNNLIESKKIARNWDDKQIFAEKKKTEVSNKTLTKSLSIMHQIWRAFSATLQRLALLCSPKQE